MTPLSIAGLIISVACALLGITGAWFTASHHLSERHFGFTCWVINSPLVVLSLVGLYLGWWESLSAICLIPMHLIYWGKACRGFRNTRDQLVD